MSHSATCGGQASSDARCSKWQTFASSPCNPYMPRPRLLSLAALSMATALAKCDPGVPVSVLPVRGAGVPSRVAAVSHRLSGCATLGLRFADGRWPIGDCRQAALEPTGYSKDGNHATQHLHRTRHLHSDRVKCVGTVRQHAPGLFRTGAEEARWTVEPAVPRP
jgi:hypothetical protein